MSLYAQAGVDYDVLDAGKRAAIAAALSTSALAASRGVTADDASRGESAFVFRFGDRHFAQVLECLGTKSTIARAVQEQTGANHFAAIGVDSVAAIVNDLACVGALPLVINAYFATGAPQWYAVPGRFAALVEGWRDGCARSGAIWGGGESPGLAGIVHDGEIDLAGSAIGALPQGCEPILGEHLGPGDEIVLLESSGLHANGASLVRRLAERLPDGYRTAMPGGRSFGDAVLAPSMIYVSCVERMLEQRVPVTYISHITGHGLRKVMRATRPLTYRLHSLPDVPESLAFIAKGLGMSDEEAYGYLNMGCGLAVFCKAGAAHKVVESAHATGHRARLAGVVDEGPRRVVLGPIGVVFDDAQLRLR
jgi:phosphoribosylformylglycinamidine cyclo-ligase